MNSGMTFCYWSRVKSVAIFIVWRQTNEMCLLYEPRPWLGFTYENKQQAVCFFCFLFPPPQKKSANGLSGGLGWFGFLGSPYARDCYIGAALESSQKPPNPH